MGPQRVVHDWATKQQQPIINLSCSILPCLSIIPFMRDCISLMCFHISILSKPNVLEDRIIPYSSLFFPPCMCLVAQLCPTLCDPLDCSPPGSSVNGDSPGKNTGVGCHALLQGIFPTQGLKLVLLHCRWMLYCLSHQGSSCLGSSKSNVLH